MPRPNRVSQHPDAGTDHRAFVGTPERYDILAALQFNLLTTLGLREHHALLDIGCGSLRAGRLFITYLLPDNYCGVEPEAWLIDAAIEHETGRDLMTLKRPAFQHGSDYPLRSFGRTFDFVLAQSVFTHASRAEIVRCMTEARAVMTANSVFVATYQHGESDYEGDDWVYPGMVPYRESTVQRLAAECGLACVPYTYPHPAGVRWILMFAAGAGARGPDGRRAVTEPPPP